MRQPPAGGLEMALQTDLYLPLRRQTRGIHDRRANFVRTRAWPAGSFDVALTRTMTPLAVDALRYRRIILRFGARLLMAWRNSRIAVVTEHAFVVDDAGRALILRAVVARIHGPIAALFRIPAERQLLQRMAACQMQVRPRVISRTQHEIDLLLLDVGFLAVKSDLPAALIIFATAADHREVTLRRFVIERVACLEIFHGILRVHPVE